MHYVYLLYPYTRTIIEDYASTQCEFERFAGLFPSQGKGDQHISISRKKMARDKV